MKIAKMICVNVYGFRNVFFMAALSPERRLGNPGYNSQGKRGRMKSFGCWLQMIIIIHTLGMK